MPLFAGVYAWLGDPRAATVCLLALTGVAASAFLARQPDRIPHARNTLAASVFLLLLSLVWLVGGIASPSVAWLSVCPMVAAAGGSRDRGLRWVAASVLAMLAVYLYERWIGLPAVLVRDLPLLYLVGNTCFILLVALFLVRYERNNDLALARLSEAMATIQRMATLDDLTGLCNRRELLRVLEAERERAERYQLPLSVCVLDIDSFKRVNDTFGHAVGDEVLRHVADTVQALARTTDCFGRYGGEEFLLVLGNTDLPGATELAERVRVAVMNSRAPGPGRPAVTLSIGVARHVHGEPIQRVIEVADRALYTAKSEGRNQVRTGGASVA
ncbi:GGDEF domain-containing protein [Massilia arenosa]|uniref:diguanylate cyclase n=1 Tax=Zemynaea arenosa TaxID=2561931 RepID=A0A4Y9SG89_9BURK|nr:GGDEF domain-containing protein [Massilia arenosa]TFW22684.1 GGDEF domain-containing protein [Massilia arenosa]